MRKKIISLVCLVTAAAAASAQEVTTTNSDSLHTAAREAADSVKQDTSDVIVIRRVPLESGRTIDDDMLVVDTIPSSNEGVSIVLFNDNTWRYVRNRNVSAEDDTVFTSDWDTVKLQAYDIELKDMPVSVVIDLVDSLKSYHYPIVGKINSKYGVRRRRSHQGTDIDLEVGDPVYATFDGRVRISQYQNGGYGNLIIIRHDNGLETYYGHLSKRLVEPDDWVTAGQVIGYGGSTGRSTGPHLHFETRYKGQSFDAERLIDFATGTLRRETFLLKRSYFSIYSKFTQDFDEEVKSEAEDKKIAAQAAAVQYHIVKRGDTMGRIAINYHTTVSRLCQLNGLKNPDKLSIGQRIRVR